MNKDRKAKDTKRNNIFAAAFDYLKRNTDITTQKELANRMGVTKDTVSRIIRAKTDVTEDAITRLQTASDCIFNLQWLRGESDIMLANDAESVAVDENRHESIQLPDYSSLMNATIAAQDAAIASLKREIVKTEESAKRDIQKAEESAKREIAAKEETITSLRNQLKDKDATIAAKDAQLKDKDATIAEKDARIADKQAMIVNLQEQVAELKQRLSAYQSKEILGDYPFKMGAADEGEQPSAGKQH